ncbi:MAG: L1 family membrane protein [Thermoplasmata archaeon]
MGPSISTNASIIRNNMLNSAYQGCATGEAVNEAHIKDFKLKTPSWCKDIPGFTGVTVDQSSTVKADCMVGALQNSVANVAQKLSAKAQAGLGFAVATNIQATQQNIENYVNQTCANQMSKNEVKWEDVDLETCNFRIIQGATVHSNCQLNATQQLAAKVAVEMAAESRGFNILAGIIGIIVLLVVLGGIGGAIYYFMNKKPEEEKEEETKSETKEKQEGGFLKLFGELSGNESFLEVLKRNKCQVTLGIIILLVLIALILTPLLQRKPITQNDIDKLNKSISDARNITEIDKSKVIVDTNPPCVPISDFYQCEQLEAPTSLDEYYKTLL